MRLHLDHLLSLLSRTLACTLSLLAFFPTPPCTESGTKRWPRNHDGSSRRVLDQILESPKTSPAGRCAKNRTLSHHGPSTAAASLYATAGAIFHPQPKSPTVGTTTIAGTAALPWLRSTNVATPVAHSRTVLCRSIPYGPSRSVSTIGCAAACASKQLWHAWRRGGTSRTGRERKACELGKYRYELRLRSSYFAIMRCGATREPLMCWMQRNVSIRRHT